MLRELKDGKNFASEYKALEQELIKQGEQIKQLASQIFGSNNAQAIRRLNQIKPSPINPMDSQSLAIANNSIETRASLKDDNSFEYLRSQLLGMVKLFELHMSNHYFEWLVEFEDPKTKLVRVADILDQLTRHGLFLSQTEILTMFTRTRTFIRQTAEEGPTPYNDSTIYRLQLGFTSSLQAQNILNEPNPLNKPDGLQPNASAFHEFFSSTWKTQEFVMILLEILSAARGQQ